MLNLGDDAHESGSAFVIDARQPGADENSFGIVKIADCLALAPLQTLGRRAVDWSVAIIAEAARFAA